MNGVKMRFEEVEFLLENIDRIIGRYNVENGQYENYGEKGKLKKNEAKYYHYTSLQNFHDIVKCFKAGQGLRGKFYNANTYNYKCNTRNKDGSTNEFCLVRSDRVPDRSKYRLSGNIGDIKFTFKEDEFVRRFGKIKPIEEFAILNRKAILEALDDFEKDLDLEKLNKVENKKDLDFIKKSFFNLRKYYYGDVSFEELQKIFEKVSIYMKHPENVTKFFKQCRGQLKQKKEHLESRVRVPDGKFITIDLIKQILFPDYLMGKEEINSDISDLKDMGFNNIAFYKCKYPKDSGAQEKGYWNYEV